jgi:2-dehydro-3-deoxyphosphogluconate aldolase/(4S)-4-hydroxy-2-oxoglutarate aldolase
MKYLDEIPIVGIIRGAEGETADRAIEAAVAGGIRTLEITLNRDEAFEQISRIKNRFGDEISLGAGTVLDVAAAADAISAGAEFIVTPALLPEVIACCQNRSVVIYPGAVTPTEILAAHRAGAEMVKVFPAGRLGPEYIKSLKGPFPEIRLMPTGGIGLGAFIDFLEAGADAVGIGGDLFNREWLASGDWSAIEQTAQAYVSAVEERR